MNKCKWFGHKEEVIYDAYDGLVQYQVSRCTRCPVVTANATLTVRAPIVEEKLQILLDQFTSRRRE